jgi:uncharacterized membrane protein YfcA
VTFAVIAFAVAVAAVVQVVSGFGFALVAAPVLVALTDPVTSVGILGVLGTLASLVTLGAGRERPQVLARTGGALVAWALPGLVLGVVLVSRLPEDVIRAAVGVLVLAALVQRRVTAARTAAPRPSSRVGLAAAGATAGALTTTTGLNGPPLVVYLTSREVSPREARDTLAVIFVVLGLLALVALAVAGELELPLEVLALPPAVIAGGLLGHRIFDRMAEHHRHRAVTVLLLASAATALGSALA